jgi:hypothetical protein
MKYALLIYGPETADHVDNPDILAGYRKFGDAAARNIRGGERLRTSDAASLVRVRDGRTMVTDGPYAETKEQLGGFYILECADLDEATSFAAQMPTAAHGAIEVRPVWEM